MATQQARKADQTQKHCPFEDPDEVSDIVLVVEDRKLHLHRSVLILHSQVFKRMLLSDFKEKGASEIPLPGKKYDSFVQFLLQMYPVSSLEPITDETIMNMLALADEYQVEHIRRKCERYIEYQLTSQVETLSTDQKLFYLWVSDVYEYKELRDRLVDMAADTDLQDLQKSQHYPSLPLAAAKDLMLKRCEKLEETNESLTSTVVGLLTEKSDLHEQLTSEKSAHDKLRERIKELCSTAKQFFFRFSIINNCGPGEQKDLNECKRPYNTERYCKFCAADKARAAILNPLSYF